MPCSTLLCYDSFRYPRDVFICAAYILLWSVISTAFKRSIFGYFERRLLRSGKKPSEIGKACEKFSISFFKLFSYSFLLAYSAYVFHDQAWLNDPNEYAKNWADGIPSKARVYYFLEVSYYIYCSIALFFEPKGRDFVQMLVHHIVTLSLMLLSYYFCYLRIGIVVMVLHDVADPVLEVAKLCNYFGFRLAANVVFSVFAAVFIYTRNYLFPKKILLVVWRARGKYYLVDLFFALLASLEVIQLIWSAVIVRMALRINQINGDPREAE